MDKSKLFTLLLVAFFFVAWGGYKVAKASYIAVTWEKTQGTIVDFEKNTWTCGKGVGTCYTLIAGYHAGKNFYTTPSDKKFNYNKPTHLMHNKVDIYYDPHNPADATFAGEYGSINGGIILVLVGIALLIIFWFLNKKT